MRILITGLPGSGKTYLADKLHDNLKYPIFNGDEVRAYYRDWDFTYEGRYRQAERMYELSKDLDDVIFDFIAPLPEFRDIVQPDFIIWMDTINGSKYPDTDKLYVPPTNPDIILHKFDYNFDSILTLLRECLP